MSRNVGCCQCEDCSIGNTSHAIGQEMPELRAIVCWGMPARAQLTRLGVSVKAPAGASPSLILIYVMLQVQWLNINYCICCHILAVSSSLSDIINFCVQTLCTRPFRGELELCDSTLCHLAWSDAWYNSAR